MKAPARVSNVTMPAAKSTQSPSTTTTGNRQQHSTPRPRGSRSPWPCRTPARRGIRILSQGEQQNGAVVPEPEREDRQALARCLGVAPRRPKEPTKGDRIDCADRQQADARGVDLMAHGTGSGERTSAGEARPGRPPARRRSSRPRENQKPTEIGRRGEEPVSGRVTLSIAAMVGVESVSHAQQVHRQTDAEPQAGGRCDCRQRLPLGRPSRGRRAGRWQPPSQ